MGGLSKSRSCFALLPDDDTVSTPASHHHHHFGELEPTSLFISGNEGEPEQRLYLPRSGTAPCSLDEYLCSIPRVASRACDLFNNDNNVCNSSTDYEHNNHNTNTTTTTTTALNTTTTTTRCLNVLQGEVAHASSLQTDVVVSAEATTCHIVALRSTTSVSVPVVSLAHVDQAYDSCLEAMVQEHIRHHHHHSNNSTTTTTTTTRADSQVLEEQDSDEYGYFWDDDEEPTEYLEQVKGRPSEDEDDHYHELIKMELHMLGGFLDKDGTSQELSTSLVTTFSYLAKKYRDKVRISLSTAAISCMNSSSSAADTTTTMPAAAAPKGRGLGIDIRTGKVFSVKTTLPAHLEGPALEVRLARAWARACSTIKGEKAALSVIHDTKSEHGHLRIEPFLYEPLETLNALLQVPDDVLLHYTSTSPECESAQFCGQLRRTLSFLNTVPKENVFGKDCKSTLVYSRSAGNLNEWEQVVPQATKQQRT